MDTRVGAELAGLALAADTVALTGNAAAAARLYEALRPLEGRRVPAPEPDVAGASVAYYLGLLARTRGRLETAADHFERALASHLEAGEDGLAARARLELARVLLARGDEPSRRQARIELEAVRLWPGAAGTPLGDEAMGMLARAQQGSQHEQANVIRCDGEYWTLVFDGRGCHVRDTRGLHWLALLLRNPGQEFPVLTVETAGRGAASTADENRDDPAATERARVRITRALQAARTRIAAAHPELGRHLDCTIRTGRVCSYVPDPRLPVEWTG
jgi:hypothetical protein